MNRNLAAGAWPTMITPYTEDGGVDYDALGRLVDWYLANGAGGLFAVCQSSEIFNLSLEERIGITKFVKQRVAGKVPVIASGHVSYALPDQEAELNAVAGCGVDALILITNRLASQNESDDIFLKRLEKLIKRLPEDMPLGFYECPYPYKRLLTPQVIQYCVDSGRFYFLKDTSCDLNQIGEKLSLLKNSRMKLFNANTATLLESLKLGAAGYSGVMANFQMKLYSWLVANWEKMPELARKVQDILTVCSFVEMKNYPANAKCYLNSNGVPMRESSRKGSQRSQNSTEKLELSQIAELTWALENRLGI